MVTVRQVLRSKANDLWTISETATAFEALELLAEKNIGALPVLNKAGKLCGIFSERDYARKVILKGKSSRKTLVKELMTAEVFHVRPGRNLRDCMFLMTEKRIRHLPVIEGDQLIGIITIGDVVKGIIRSQEQTINALEGYVSGALYT